MNSALVWLRQDLRLHDNPALSAALVAAEQVIPVFIYSPDNPLGAASRWWLHHSLCAMQQALQAQGSDLIVRCGPPLTALRELLTATGAQAVYWNRRYEPAQIACDQQIKAALRQLGVKVHSSNGYLLWEPWTVATGQGGAYKVFTPFWRKCLTQPPGPELPTPRYLPPVPRLFSQPIESLGLLPQIAWDSGFYSQWQPGEQGAWARLATLSTHTLPDYAIARDIPALEGSSRLSAHLHYGEISVRSVWHQVQQAVTSHPTWLASAQTFERELGWREFAYHLLYHFPDTLTEPLHARFAAFPWRSDYQQDVIRWQQGKTGIPILDAGMRQLWHSGWMHNRVRMLVASYLTKNLRIPWQVGAQWFEDTLVDADSAANTLGWQWSAGCGADAAPYFRIFNPVTQGEKFDPNGEYVRHWVPELANFPVQWLHKPWLAPRPPPGYGMPLVDIAASRQAALDAYQHLRHIAG